MKDYDPSEEIFQVDWAFSFQTAVLGLPVK